MSHRVFTATLPDGQQVLVQVWDIGAELAFRPAPDPSITWGVPVSLTEQPS